MQRAEQAFGAPIPGLPTPLFFLPQRAHRAPPNTPRACRADLVVARLGGGWARE